MLGGTLAPYGTLAPNSATRPPLPSCLDTLTGPPGFIILPKKKIELPSALFCAYRDRINQIGILTEKPPLPTPHRRDRRPSKCFCLREVQRYLGKCSRMSVRSGRGKSEFSVLFILLHFSDSHYSLSDDVYLGSMEVD